VRRRAAGGADRGAEQASFGHHNEGTRAAIMNSKNLISWAGRPIALALVLATAVACHGKAQKKEGSTLASSSSAPAAATITESVTDAAAPSPARGASVAPAPRPKKYLRVLHTGDSMVGGGLALALRPKFEADGVKYRRDVIESGTIHEFAQSDHLPKLLASFKPDLLLLTLGANHMPSSVEPDKELGPFVAKLIKRVSGIDCYWLAPPIWKPSQARFNEWLREHVAPCRFYDASVLTITRRPDKIHPDEKGGEVWADGLWKFMKGEGAFFEKATGAPAPSGL
jgi:lysophospholipase L1-like esterase